MGDTFFYRKNQYRYPLTQYKYSPPAVNCCLSRDQTAVGGGRRSLCNNNYLDLLANNGSQPEEWHGAGEGGSAPVEWSPFMTHWKDCPGIPSAPHTVSHIQISAAWGDVAGPPAVPGGFSCHWCTAVKVTGARKHMRLCDGLCT